MASLAEAKLRRQTGSRQKSQNSCVFLTPEQLAGESWLVKAPENSLLNKIPYCSRAISRNCRAVASRNVSMLAPGGGSRPDFAWTAEAIRNARA